MYNNPKVFHCRTTSVQQIPRGIHLPSFASPSPYSNRKISNDVSFSTLSRRNEGVTEREESPAKRYLNLSFAPNSRSAKNSSDNYAFKKGSLELPDSDFSDRFQNAIASKARIRNIFKIKRSSQPSVGKASYMRSEVGLVTPFRRKCISIGVQSYTPKPLSFTFNLGECNLFSKDEKKVDERIDLAIFYSCPLVLPVHSNSTFQKYVELPKRLNYDKEISQIVKSLEETYCQLNYMVSVCTCETFTSSLNSKLKGIHFIGHGLKSKSVAGIGSQKNEGDMLLLEDELCKGFLLSTQALKTILKSHNTRLDFVFVSSCHSSLIGNVFLSAGAKHVICIQRNSQIRDDVAIEFSNRFYSALFRGSLSVCEAFASAQAQMTTDPIICSEVSKFTLLKKSGTYHRCKAFSKFSKGKCKNCSVKPFFHNLPLKMFHFIDHCTELFQIINSFQDKRLISIQGKEGIGKTALLRILSHFLYDRNFFKDGIIFLNCKNLENTIQFFQALLKSSSSEQNKNLNIRNNRSTEIESILATTDAQNEYKLESLVEIYDHKEMLLILDTTDTLFENRDKEMKMFLSTLLTANEKLRVIITSKEGLSDFLELESFELSLKGLDPDNSCLLLEKLCLRPILEDEKEDLVGDLEYFSICNTEFQFKDHNLFKILGGHPQSICLAADLLQSLSLSELYKLLVKPTSVTLTKRRDKEIWDNLICSLNTFRSYNAQNRIKKLSAINEDKMQNTSSLSFVPLERFKPNKQFTSQPTFVATKEGVDKFLKSTGQKSMIFRKKLNTPALPQSTLLKVPPLSEKKNNIKKNETLPFIYEESLSVQLNPQKIKSKSNKGAPQSSIYKAHFKAGMKNYLVHDSPVKQDQQNAPNFLRNSTIFTDMTFEDSADDSTSVQKEENTLYKYFYFILMDDLHEIEQKMQNEMNKIKMKLDISAHFNKYLATVYLLKNNPRKAMQYYKVSKNQYSAQNLITGFASTLFGIGICFFQSKRNEEAKQKISKAITLFQKLNYKRIESILSFRDKIFSNSISDNFSKQLTKVLALLLEL